MIGEASAAVEGLGPKLALSILIVGEAAALFAGFCPSWFTVRSSFFHEQSARAGNMRSIRQGEIAATSVTMLIGIGSGYMIKSALPIIAAAGTSAIMIAGYEYSMSHPASEDKTPSRASSTMDSLHLALAWRTA